MIKLKEIILFFLFVVAVGVVGCSKRQDITPCTLVPITPTPTHSDFKSFTIFGPEVNGDVSAIFIHEDHAYVKVGDSLVIFDVQNPSQPVQLGVYPGGDVPKFIKEGYAYAYWDASLHILDVSHPDNPVEVGCLNGTNLDLSNAVFAGNYAYQPTGNYAYQPNGVDAVKIFDVSNMTSPYEVASYHGEYIPRSYYVSSPRLLSLDVAVSGDFAYVGEGLAGVDSLFGGQLTILDVSKPNKPRKVSEYQMPRNTAAMQVMVIDN